jgi:hypothetical protein
MFFFLLLMMQLLVVAQKRNYPSCIICRESDINDVKWNYVSRNWIYGIKSLSVNKIANVVLTICRITAIFVVKDN